MVEEGEEEGGVIISVGWRWRGLRRAGGGKEE